MIKEGVLSGYRAIDLTDQNGFFCGKILADLGMEVIKIEPPGGESARNIGPFYHGIADPEKSLNWFAYNSNKKGITLDIEAGDGKEIFKRLVQRSDFVIESFPVGYMDKVGLGYSELSQINRRIIMTSISLFGQTGAYKDYKASDLTLMAMSGFMYLTGPEECPPLRISVPQSHLFGGIEAAAASMIALWHRERTSEGQHVDIPIWSAAFMASGAAREFWETSNVILKRCGIYRVGLSTKMRQRQIYRCKDGFVCLATFGGKLGAESNRMLIEWAKGEGINDKYLDKIHWEELDVSVTPQEVWDRIEKIASSLFLRHTKEELWGDAIQKRIMLYPVQGPHEISSCVQLRARQFWVEVEHPELGVSIEYPRAPIVMSETPIQPQRRAPLIGEHNREIYCDLLGLSSEEITTLKEAGVI